MMELLRQSADSWGIRLARSQLEQFEGYYRLLVSWNERINLTRITEYGQVQVLHFLDSLAILAAMLGREVPSPARLIDVGSGQGLPGLALKIARPDLSVTLVESVGKKAEFLRRVADELGLQDVQVDQCRAEEAARTPGHREAYSHATARALGGLAVALELSAPFVRVGGVVLLPRKGDAVADQQAAAEACELIGVRFLHSWPVALPGVADGRIVSIYEKVAPTSERFPRRPGIPAKRPLFV